MSVVTGLRAELRRHINSGKLDFMPGEPYRATLNGKLRCYGGQLHLIREGKLHIVRQKG